MARASQGYADVLTSILREVEEGRRKEAQEKWRKNALARINKRYREIEQKILGSQGFKNHLHIVERLEKHGVERGTLLRLLALAASAPSHRDWWRNEIRRRVAALDSLSTRLETVSRDTTKLLKDPFCKVEFWSWLLGGSEAITDPTQLTPSASWAVSILRGLARSTKHQARMLGAFLRRASLKQDRFDQLVLLAYIQQATRQTRQNFDEETATLLNDCFDALPQQRSRVKSEHLRKLRERYLKPGRATSISWRLIGSGQLGGSKFPPN